MDLIQTSFTRHKLVYLHVTSKEMLLTELLLLVLLVMLHRSPPFVSICLGCLLLLFGACSSTEHNVSLFGLWLQDANRPLNRSMPSPLLLVVFCSTGCESLLVSLFVVVLFFQHSLLMVSFGRYPFKQL